MAQGHAVGVRSSSLACAREIAISKLGGAGKSRSGVVSWSNTSCLSRRVSEYRAAH